MLPGETLDDSHEELWLFDRQTHLLSQHSEKPITRIGTPLLAIVQQATVEGLHSRDDFVHMIHLERIRGERYSIEGGIRDLLRIADSLLELSIENFIKPQKEELHFLDLVQEHFDLVRG